jgi:hypothetical protein
MAAIYHSFSWKNVIIFHSQQHHFPHPNEITLKILAAIRKVSPIPIYFLQQTEKMSVLCATNLLTSHSLFTFPHSTHSHVRRIFLSVGLEGDACHSQPSTLPSTVTVYVHQRFSLPKWSENDDEVNVERENEKEKEKVIAMVNENKIIYAECEKYIRCHNTSRNVTHRHLMSHHDMIQ